MKKAFLPWKRTVLPVLLTLLLCLAGVTNAMAQSFTVGDLNYSINDDGASVTVTGHVDGTSATGELVIPESVELYGTLYPVTVIGEYAFQYCNGLTGDLVIPNSVITLGRGAFYSCHGFTGSLTIGDAVQTIGYDAFSECYGFTGSLTIGDAVQTIDGYAFHNCSGFTGTLTIPESVTQINYDAFKYCRFTTLNYNAINCYLYGSDWGDESYHWLGYCSFLTTVNIGDSVHMIPDCFLRYRSSASGELVIPNSVTTIGNYAFENCTGFTGSLTIPNSVTIIGNNAFNGCTGFTGSLTIGNSVSLIGSSAFNGCNGFASALNIGNSVISIRENAFNGCSGFTGSLKIPNSVLTIGNSAFNGCSGFTGAPTIGNSVTSIGENAFNGCSGFTGSLTIPNAVTTIGNSAFMNCTGFSGTLTLGQSLTEIDNSAFFGACEGFTAFNVLVEVPPTLGTNVFLSVNTGIPVHVRCGALEAYQNASGWNSFTNIQEFNPCVWVITATVNPTMGGMVSGVGIYEQGQTCTLTATANDDYAFVNWMENGEEVSTEAYYAFTVTGDRNLVANFRNTRYHIQVSIQPEAGGTVNGIESESQQLYYDFENHTLQGWTSIDADGDGNNWMINSQWNPSVAGHNGSTDFVMSESYNNSAICPNNYLVSPQILLGGSISFYACAQDAYWAAEHFGVAVSMNSNTNPNDFQMVQEWTLSAKGIGAPTDATRSGNRSQGYWYQYTVDLSGYTGFGYVAIRHFNCCDWYHLNIDDIIITTNSIGNYLEGETCTLTATPNEDYVFVNWTENGEEVSTDASYSFIVTSDRNLVANFRYLRHEITAIANPESGGTISGTGNYYEGETCTLTATPFGEYEFGNWTENGAVVSTDAVYTFTVESSRNLVANFTNPNFIIFADPSVEARCIELWDSNGDGHLSYDEAAAVTDLNWAFQYWGITSFNELQYFTGLTFLHDYEFYDCENLASITIPESVTSIGNSAFSNCSGFIGSLTIPDNVTYIGGSAFANCSGFNGTLTLPATLTSIGSSAFANCTGFTGTLTIPESVTSVGNRAFANTGFTTVNYNAINCSNLGGEDYDEYWNWVWFSAFMNCQSMTTLNIGNNVQTIPYRAFEGISSLTGSLTIPESITSIGGRAFAGTGFTTLNFNAIDCESLQWYGNYNGWNYYSCMVGLDLVTTLTIGDNVQTIPDYAFKNFSGCTGSLVIPNSVTSIGGSAFENCTSLSGSLTLPESVTSIGGSAFANCSGFTGSLTIPDNVTSIGGSAFANCSGFTGALTLSATLTSIEGSTFNGCSGFTGSLTIPDNVTYIGESAFKNCSGFTTLTIGSGLVWIDYTNEWDARYYTESAFYGCTGFTTLNYNAINCPRLLCYDGNWYEKSVFSNCTSLITLNIGENVQSLPTAAFSGTSFTTINFNATNCVSNFNWYTAPIFRDSPYLTTLNIGENVQTIPERAFMDCGFVGNLVLPESLTTINHYAFCNCSGFTGNLTIPESVTTIGERAFYGCSGFTGNLLIPNSVSYIGSQAFYGCSSFTGNLLIPNSVSYIGSRAFNGCSGMEGTLTIGHSVTEIGYAAFNNTALTTLNYEATQCNSIDEYGGENASVFYNFTTVDFGDNVESIPYRAFYGCANLTGNLILPNSLAHIGDQAFYNCYGLESLMLNNSLETIGREAFRNCGGLKGELILPEALLSVGNNAFTSCDEISTITYNAIHCTEMGNAQSPVFYDCASIAHINIGENVQSIPNYAFKRCSTVVDMRVGAVTPPVIASSTFGTVSRSIPVSVPYGSGDAYRSAQYWEEFFNITEDYSPNPFTYHWNVNPHQFAGNMTVTGIIQIEGVEQAIPSLEIGAFCNGECRGRQLLTYYPQVDRYLVFLMLYGEDGDVFNFRLFDHGAGQELTAGCTSVIAFETDATIGSFSNPYVFNFTNVQVSEFTEGWSWWSTYIEMAGIDGLSMLESGLGTNGIIIKSQSDGYTEYYDDYDLWYGSLGSINNESSYMVKTSVPCTVTMPGTTALPSQHPITVDANGWTWIGYPVAHDMDINAALEGLASLEGDVLKSQEGYAEFYEGYGWFGSLATFLPGMGYMYKSTSASPATFTYPGGSKGDVANANLSVKDNHWVPAVSAYPFNMTVTAVVELDGEELRSDRYELAAFANGESRGSVRLMYVEPIDRYVAFLTVAGEEAADLSFALYDTETGMECLSANEAIAFEANATVGRLGEPFVVSFRGTTGMDELANSLHVYPNPVNAGERFRIGLNTESKAPVRVEIVNALGITVSVETSTQTPANIKAPEVAGIYTMRVIVDGKGMCSRKLIVK